MRKRLIILSILSIVFLSLLYSCSNDEHEPVELELTNVVLKAEIINHIMMTKKNRTDKANIVVFYRNINDSIDRYVICNNPNGSRWELYPFHTTFNVNGSNVIFAMSSGYNGMPPTEPFFRSGSNIMADYLYKNFPSIYNGDSTLVHILRHFPRLRYYFFYRWFNTETHGHENSCYLTFYKGKLVDKEYSNGFYWNITPFKIGDREYESYTY